MRKPDLAGIGQAWNIPTPEVRPDGNPHAAVSQWLLNGPWHPFWSFWMATIVHLRPQNGLPPAKKESDDVTHEFMIFGLDPGDPKKFTQYDPDNLPFPLPFLKPIDVVVQFACESDAKAADICDSAVRAILSGIASPDQDFRSFWERTIKATAACGKHPEKNVQ